MLRVRQTTRGSGSSVHISKRPKPPRLLRPKLHEVGSNVTNAKQDLKGHWLENIGVAMVCLPSASQLQASRVRVPFAAPVPPVLASDIKRKEWHSYDCMT